MAAVPVRLDAVSKDCRDERTRSHQMGGSCKFKRPDPFFNAFFLKDVAFDKPSTLKTKLSEEIAPNQEALRSFNVPWMVAVSD